MGGSWILSRWLKTLKFRYVQTTKRVFEKVDTHVSNVSNRSSIWNGQNFKKSISYDLSRGRERGGGLGVRKKNQSEVSHTARRREYWFSHYVRFFAFYACVAFSVPSPRPPWNIQATPFQHTVTAEGETSSLSPREANIAKRKPRRSSCFLKRETPRWKRVIERGLLSARRARTNTTFRYKRRTFLAEIISPFEVEPPHAHKITATQSQLDRDSATLVTRIRARMATRINCSTYISQRCSEKIGTADEVQQRYSHCLSLRFSESQYGSRNYCWETVRRVYRASTITVTGYKLCTEDETRINLESKPLLQHRRLESDWCARWRGGLL